MEEGSFITLIGISVTVLLAVAGALWKTIYDKVKDHSDGIDELKKSSGDINTNLGNLNVAVNLRMEAVSGQVTKNSAKIEEHSRAINCHDRKLSDHERILEKLAIPRRRAKRVSSSKSP